MPQYAILIYADDSAHSPDATAADTASADAYADELVDSGDLVAAYAFTPRSMATSLRAGSTTEGAFVDGAPVVAGFYVIEAADVDTALAIAGRNPVLASGGGVEVRPLHSGGGVDPALDASA
ncbi:hypothetical protein ELQ92_08085 [Labedella populi]|uniref:YCII-related domain-containing protein n=1 Tax=Labedella populi TaxID=2498850 RepID=A0A3S3ZU02_9MICO|nr:YciI family protein [Labedella populi]RWZ64685.1 hypothetical protein ELQ92_08085 [Labedella populi]